MLCGDVNGKAVQKKRGDVCIHVAGSLCWFTLLYGKN